MGMKNNLCVVFAFFSLCFVASCSDAVSEYSGESSANGEVLCTSTDVDGMVCLPGGTVTLGSDDTKYKANERPSMEVTLDYAFYLDVHEVTCGDYRNVASKTGLSSFACDGDSLPIANVTFYDAVLYANAKSVMEKRDTAYTYRKATFDNDGHCTDLEGFAFHPESDGFRLPTEAEWVLAATKAWNPDKSWNGDNSGFRARNVCGKGKDGAGFCDLAGNVMEWVNDWLGLFRDTTVYNYIGAPDGGAVGERVVKGGYYASFKDEQNVYSRGDVYTVTSSTRADYVGFRLALGKIPNALWMGNDGKSRTSVVTLLAGSETIKSSVGTYNVKLAFRDDVTGNIAYVDYLNGSLSVNEIESDVSAYHPEISPDGNYVAFCTGQEGVSGKSKLYVHKLGVSESEPVKLKVESAAIPRWRVLDNGDTAIVYVTDAGNNKNGDDFKSSSTWQVTFKNGKFGTPKKLFDGSYHGGISDDNTLAVTGARLLRARIAKSGSTLTEKASDVVWYDSAQACNASLALDGTKRTAFLDFGGKPGKKFVGKTYGTHERILIADSNGKLVQSIKAPADYAFDHAEWVKNGSLLVATLTNANGAHSKIVLVNPSDSSVTDLVEGEELWHPSLWLKKRVLLPADTDDDEFVLDPDSAGIYYNNSGACGYAVDYRYKMELLWQYKNLANVVILGSSRALYGIDPMEFSEPVLAINLATPAGSIYGTGTYFYNYILPHVRRMKVLVLALDLDRAYNTGRNANNMFYKAYTFYPGYVYDKNHDFWVNKFPKSLAKATYDSPGSAEVADDYRQNRGFLKKYGDGWGSPKVAEDSCWMDSHYEDFQNNYALLRNLIDTCAVHDIKLVGVIAPLNPRYKKTGAFGYRGLRRSDATRIIQELDSLSKVHPNFILMDENKMGNHDYTDDMAMDASHLSPKGAAQLTSRIDSLIKTLKIDFDE